MKREKADEIVDKEELIQTADDLDAEESDLEFGKKHKLRLKRPPKTSSEALKTLQEADARFELGKRYLAGGDDKLYKMKSEKQKEDEKQQILLNVPNGITLSRLVFPMDK